MSETAKQKKERLLAEKVAAENTGYSDSDGLISHIPASEAPVVEYPVKIDSHPQSLPCALEESDISRLGRSLGRTLRELEAMKEEHKSIRDQHKSEVSALESTIKQITLAIDNLEEYRLVDVIIELHADENVQVRRQDTGEIIETRKALPQEIQLGLPEAARDENFPI